MLVEVCMAGFLPICADQEAMRLNVSEHCYVSQGTSRTGLDPAARHYVPKFPQVYKVYLP